MVTSSSKSIREDIHRELFELRAQAKHRQGMGVTSGEAGALGERKTDSKQRVRISVVCACVCACVSVCTCHSMNMGHQETTHRR